MAQHQLVFDDEKASDLVRAGQTLSALLGLSVIANMLRSEYLPDRVKFLERELEATARRLEVSQAARERQAQELVRAQVALGEALQDAAELRAGHKS